jgi:hypothetical protein
MLYSDMLRPSHMAIFRQFVKYYKENTKVYNETYFKSDTILGR